MTQRSAPEAFANRSTNQIKYSRAHKLRKWAIALLDSLSAAPRYLIFFFNSTSLLYRFFCFFFGLNCECQSHKFNHFVSFVVALCLYIGRPAAGSLVAQPINWFNNHFAMSNLGPINSWIYSAYFYGPIIVLGVERHVCSGNLTMHCSLRRLPALISGSSFTENVCNSVRIGLDFDSIKCQNEHTHLDI